MRVIRAVAVLALCFAAATTACRTAAHGNRLDEPAQPTTVSVENRGFYDMNVYVLQSGGRVRLGTAPGHQTTVLRIPDYLVTGSADLRFLMHPIGPNEEPVSESVAVFPGDQVVLIVY